MRRNFHQLRSQSFDLLVCGGGIYGAWTAYDAALRGLKVAIADKGDWACGTSSASSKLIHGGLRYLETFDFKLVKKSLMERQTLLKTAPHRVWPLRFGIPVFKNNRLGSLRLKIGLSLYDFLAGKMANNQRYQHLSSSEFSQHFPHLATKELLSGFTYFDAQCDDARLVLEIIDGASMAGAVCTNYCAATDLIEQAGVLCGAVLQDQITGETVNIAAKQIVDTTGRWSQDFKRTHDGSRFAKGIHLVMPNVLNNEALLLTAKSDGRVFFMIPWYGLTLLGTTDTNYQGDLEHLPITGDDIQYLLSEANHVLGNTHWSEQDIISKFAGVRVLQQSTADNPSKVSRDWILLESTNGLLSSIGGKLTSAREDASHIVDSVCARLGIRIHNQTFGKPFPWIENADYQHLLAEATAKANTFGIDKICAEYLLKRHGQRVDDIFKLCQNNPALTQRIRTELPFIMADLVFCAQNEMVIHLNDLLRRRLPLLILAKCSTAEITEIGRLIGPSLGWDSRKIEAEIKHCEQN